MRILLLGGTTEASRLADTIAAAGIDAVFSYAGRTNTPVAQPLPTRIGGFGGIDGLVRFLITERITHVIDATHPFAAGMTRNAFAACQSVNLPLIRFERPAWVAGIADNWTMATAVEDIPALLPDMPTQVFLAIGKQQIGLFASKPQHHYLLRLVDHPAAPIALPDKTIVVARGPFDQQGDTELLKAHGITHVVAKNSGGTGAQAKLEAARALGLPVIMANRPDVPGRSLASIRDVMSWLGHEAERGV
ncbi:Precorrin-6x reductase [Sulfitobacter noctilucicola]|uniref:Precorrin-6A/cobalt-precorrin-6A reductase n=2 Tax=Sulfitobacter noctilucicola TaxID=1342301 RepID=A0A7W6Q1V6_9RHOB|nr:Precorrin-6x reductase [Sulfitobacter noctilucicola]MBB4172445.1 precorrin-6A/cobalt-precorrin-6A reductase [Sulfitobacter noctilucicola]